MKAYLSTAQLTSDAAQTVANAALARAREIGIRVSVAALGLGGAPPHARF